MTCTETCTLPSLQRVMHGNVGASLLAAAATGAIPFRLLMWRVIWARVGKGDAHSRTIMRQASRGGGCAVTVPRSVEPTRSRFQQNRTGVVHQDHSENIKMWVERQHRGGCATKKRSLWRKGVRRTQNTGVCAAWHHGQDLILPTNAFQCCLCATEPQLVQLTRCEDGTG